MPFGPARFPHLGVSLPKAVLDKLEIKTKNFYFNLRFINEFGLCMYEILNGELDWPINHFFGELLFS